MKESDPAKTGLVLPSFIGVGPPRTGTTWLSEVLKDHAGLPRGTKETHFFLKNYSKGLRWYSDYFRGYPPGMPLGEIDPTYFAEPNALERIARHIPHCRIICSFRDPVERAYSSYRVMRRDAWTRVGFEETLARNRLIRESSRYAYYLSRWREIFGEERVLATLYDELAASPQSYLDAVCGFIGAPRIGIEGIPAAGNRLNTVTHAPRSRRLAQNARNARDRMRERKWHRTVRLLEKLGIWRLCFGGGERFPPLDPATDARLRERFLPEIEAFERMIGRDLSAWKRPRPAPPQRYPARSAAASPGR